MLISLPSWHSQQKKVIAIVGEETFLDFLCLSMVCLVCLLGLYIPVWIWCFPMTYNVTKNNLTVVCITKGVEGQGSSGVLNLWENGELLYTGGVLPSSYLYLAGILSAELWTQAHWGESFFWPKTSNFCARASSDHRSFCLLLAVAKSSTVLFP